MSSFTDQSNEMIENIIKKEKELQQRELQSSEDKLTCMHKAFLEIKLIAEKVKYLENLEMEDVIALRELFIKQFLTMNSIVVSNLELITNFIYKS